MPPPERPECILRLPSLRFVAAFAVLFGPALTHGHEAGTATRWIEKPMTEGRNRAWSRLLFSGAEKDQPRELALRLGTTRGW